LKEELNYKSKSIEDLEEQLRNSLSEGEAAVLELRSQLDTIRLELETQNAEADQLSSYNEKLLASSKEQEDKFNQARADLERSAQMIAEKELLLESVSHEVTALKSTVASLESCLEETKVEKSNLELAHHELSNQLKVNQERLGDSELNERQLISLEAEVAALKSQLEAVSTAKSVCATLETENSGLHTKINQLETQLEEVTNRECNLNEELASLRLSAAAEKSLLEAQIADLNETNSALQRQMDQDRKQRESAQSEVTTDLEAKLSDSAFRIQELERHLTEATEQITCFEEDKAKLEAKLTDYSQALVDIKGMNETILAKARDSDKEVVRLKAGAEDLQRQNSEMAAELVRLSEELAASAGRLAQVEAELAASAGRLAQAEAELTAKGAESRDEEEVKHLIQVINEKTRELNQARSENSHLMEQLGEERDRREQLELSGADLR
jgi:chromosome segregation ATPase